MVSLVAVTKFCLVVGCLEEGFVADLFPTLARFDRLINGHEEGRELGQKILGGLLHNLSRYSWAEYEVIVIIYTKKWIISKIKIKIFKNVICILIFEGIFVTFV